MHVDPTDAMAVPRRFSDAVPHVVLLRYADGALYLGAQHNGQPDGHGVCVYPSGTVCAGHFSRGHVDGDADVLSATGALFSGVFWRSLAHGDGTLLSGATLTRGEWRGGTFLRGTSSSTISTSTSSGGGGGSPGNGGGDGGAAGPQRLSAVPALLRGAVRALLLAPMAGQPPADGRLVEPIARAPKPTPDRAEGLATVTASTTTTTAGVKRSAAATAAGSVERAGVTQRLLARSSAHAIFACAAPVQNETLSLTLVSKFVVMFMLPFVALPRLPWSPFRSSMLEMEREFVLSGAALRREFHPPVASLCITAIAFFCHVAAIALVAARVKVGTAKSGQITVEELVVPCLLWIFHGVSGGAYHGYRPVPHPLERLDRRLTPRLFAFAAGIVDTKTQVCIYTWDEKGQGMVTNKYYRYRWMALALFLAVIMGFAAPVTRFVFHQHLFGNGDGFERAAIILAFLSTILFSATIAYYILKLTDMQRQVLAQMRVLSRLAYLEGRSLLRPSECLNEKFNFDEPLNTADAFSGVVGWHIVRSLILYASTCSNHSARSLFMSFFFLCIFCGFLLSIGDAIYFVVVNMESKTAYYSVRHSYGVVCCVMWGFLLQRYLYSCVETLMEQRRHLYLLDVASLYHISPNPETNSNASEVVSSCRRMIEAHEQLPSIFSLRIRPSVMLFIALAHLFALVAVSFTIGFELYTP